MDQAAARDLMDLYRLVALLGLPTVLAAAAEKDTGFRVELLAMAVRASDRLPASEFGITEIEYAALRERAASWTEEALQVDQARHRGTDEQGDERRLRRRH